MLVLYVLTFKLLQQQRDEYRIKAEQFERLLEIERSLEQLDDDKNFTYDPEYKRFTLIKRVSFPTGSASIPTRDRAGLVSAGKKLSQVISSAAEKDENLKYLIIIEGMASKDNYSKNFELSYARAKAVFNFWKSRNIKFDPKITEVQISGSGSGRYRSLKNRTTQSADFSADYTKDWKNDEESGKLMGIKWNS